MFSDYNLNKVSHVDLSLRGFNHWRFQPFRKGKTKIMCSPWSRSRDSWSSSRPGPSWRRHWKACGSRCTGLSQAPSWTTEDGMLASENSHYIIMKKNIMILRGILKILLPKTGTVKKNSHEPLVYFILKLINKFYIRGLVGLGVDWIWQQLFWTTRMRKQLWLYSTCHI